MLGWGSDGMMEAVEASSQAQRIDGVDAGHYVVGRRSMQVASQGK
jgi:hypothetical protein